MISLLRAYKNFDPAAKSLFEIALLYPGVKALVLHRIAHQLYLKGIPILPRMLSELGRWMTGIEIHPGAKIGNGVIIEHGTGVVIGETSEIGDDVVILQGVTLGSRFVRKSIIGKRHPTIKRGATLCAGSKILGAITVGEGASIGANAVVLSDVPAFSTAVGCPARIHLSDASNNRESL